MDTSELRTRSLAASVALLGVGAAVGAGATLLIMSARASETPPSPPSTTSTVVLSQGSGGEPTTSRRSFNDQLRDILADFELRLMNFIDDVVAHFSVSVRDNEAGQYSEASEVPETSPQENASKSQCVRVLSTALLSVTVSVFSFYAVVVIMK